MQAISKSFAGVNKFEKMVLAIFAMGLMLVATVNVVWIAEQFGINLAPGLLGSIVDAMSAGSSLGTAFATIVGVTLPGWALAAAGAMGATAA